MTIEQLILENTINHLINGYADTRAKSVTYHTITTDARKLLKFEVTHEDVKALAKRLLPSLDATANANNPVKFSAKIIQTNPFIIFSFDNDTPKSPVPSLATPVQTPASPVATSAVPSKVGTASVLSTSDVTNLVNRLVATYGKQLSSFSVLQKLALVLDIEKYNSVPGFNLRFTGPDIAELIKATTAEAYVNMILKYYNAAGIKYDNNLPASTSSSVSGDSSKLKILAATPKYTAAEQALVDGYITYVARNPHRSNDVDAIQSRFKGVSREFIRKFLADYNKHQV